LLQHAQGITHGFARVLALAPPILSMEASCSAVKLMFRVAMTDLSLTAPQTTRYGKFASRRHFRAFWRRIRQPWKFPHPSSRA
jgi:hypothetical protein